MQDVKEKNEVKEEEILKLADMYRKMTPANRFFMVSASQLMLAGQSNAVTGDGMVCRYGDPYCQQKSIFAGGRSKTPRMGNHNSHYE